MWYCAFPAQSSFVSLIYVTYRLTFRHLNVKTNLFDDEMMTLYISKSLNRLSPCKDKIK